MTPAKATITKLRRLYFATWGIEWPEPDSYLILLWRESRANFFAERARVPSPAVWVDCLMAMRECHEIPPHQLPGAYP